MTIRMKTFIVSTVALCVQLAHALPADIHDPKITPSPVLSESTKTYARRGIIDDVDSDVNSILSGLGSDVPTWVASGVPNFFQGFPTGDAVVSSLGLDSSQLAALPTNVLNLPPYGNYTSLGWQVRFHGNVYKQPNTSIEDLNKLADVFLINTNISSLPPDQQDQARNLTAEIFVVQQPNVQVGAVSLEPADTQGGSGQSGGSNAVQPGGGIQTITLPYNTTVEGDYDAFVPINSTGLMPGNTTTEVQRLNVYVAGATLGNATAYLLPDQGLTFVNDIDDILRVTKIYEPAQGLLNSFARPFTPWQNMPEIFANWSTSLPSSTSFHYLTTTPEQITRNYMQFIYANYPGGSFDTRPLNFSDVSATLSIRKFLLVKIFETFPKRKFVLIADTSNSDVMKDYPQMYHDYPDQVQCIFLRNTTASDSGDKFPYDTSGFEGIPQNKYMFFVNANDLTNLNILGGGCYNQSVPQNLTFGYQGLPLGLGKTPAVNGSAHKGAAGSLVHGQEGAARTWLVTGLVLALAWWSVC